MVYCPTFRAVTHKVTAFELSDAMKKYIIKRILTLIPVLILVSMVIFLLVHLTPGDPAAMLLGDQAKDAEIATLRDRMGFNDPLPVQYVRWLGGVLRGDLGESVFINDSMGHILLEHLGPSLALTCYALVLATLFAVPLGILAAKSRGRLPDHMVSVTSMVGISMPSFLLGLLLILLFAVKLKWLPASGYTPVSGGWLKHLKYLTLPAIALGFIESGLMIRMTRSAMLEVLDSDYIRAAKAKGVSLRSLFMKHALRNALIPIVTVIGQSFMVLLAGATVVETVFNIPGLGQLTVNSVLRRDYEVIQAIVLLVSLTNVLISLIIDLLYGAIDPRARVDAAGK